MEQDVTKINVRTTAKEMDKKFIKIEDKMDVNTIDKEQDKTVIKIEDKMDVKTAAKEQDKTVIKIEDENLCNTKSCYYIHKSLRSSNIIKTLNTQIETFSYTKNVSGDGNCGMYSIMEGFYHNGIEFNENVDIFRRLG